MAHHYCSHCGAQLRPGAGFCTQCGAPIRHAQPPAPPAPPPPPPVVAPPPVARQAAEPIVDVILGLQHQKGILGLALDTYSLIVTPSRLVFAHLDKPTMNAFVQRAKVEARAQGKGFLGQWGAQLGWMALLDRDLRAATPDQILAHSPKSFSLPHHSVSRVRVRRKTGAEGDTITHVTLVIDASSGKHRFQIPTTTRVTVRDLKRRLSRVLGNRVR